MSSRALAAAVASLCAFSAACRGAEPPPSSPATTVATPAPAPTPDPVDAALAANGALTRDAAERIAASLRARGVGLDALPRLAVLDVVEGLSRLRREDQIAARRVFEAMAARLDNAERARWTAVTTAIRAGHVAGDEPEEGMALMNAAAQRMAPPARLEFQKVCERAIDASLEARRPAEGPRVANAAPAPGAPGGPAFPGPATGGGFEDGIVAEMPRTGPRDAYAAPPSLPSGSGRSSEEERQAADERRWRERARMARDRVERAERALAAAQADASRRIVPNGEEHRLLEPQRRHEAELDAARKALADLEDSARRASVPPGWLR